MKKIQSIICIDDEKIILDSLKSMLTRNFGNNYNYEFAESGEEGLEIIDKILENSTDGVHAVISDWLMPDMKGDELLNEARRRLKNVKTIMLTGHVDNEVVQAVERSGNEIICMFKPWNETKLVNLIKG